MKDSQVQRDLLIALLKELERGKVGPERLFERAGSSDVFATYAGRKALAGDEGLRLLERAVELTGDPTLPIRLGQQVDIDSYGIFGFAQLSCRSQRDAVKNLIRYGRVFFEPMFEAHDHEGGLWLRLKLKRGTAAQQQMLVELCFSQLLWLGRATYHGRTDTIQACFKFPRPAHADIYHSALKVHIAFDCEHNQLFIPAEVLDAPVKSANSSEHLVFIMQCEAMLRELRSAEKTTAAVRRLLIMSVGEFLTISEVAQRLNVSERTLRRRLEAESSSFGAVLDEIRNLLATEYLRQTRMTVADIAHLLGYTEPVNFRRAFLRWNGSTPSDYRLQAL